MHDETGVQCPRHKGGSTTVSVSRACMPPTSLFHLTDCTPSCTDIPLIPVANILARSSAMWSKDCLPGPLQSYTYPRLSKTVTLCAHARACVCVCPFIKFIKYIISAFLKLYLFIYCSARVEFIAPQRPQKHIRHPRTEVGLAYVTPEKRLLEMTSTCTSPRLPGARHTCSPSAQWAQQRVQ